MLEYDDIFFMKEALKEALKAAEIGETPIGAVIVHENKIIARAHNQVETLKDATAHAEMIALTQAQAHFGDWRLDKCDLYVTREPCVMCFGALLLTRVKGLVYGIADDRGWGMSGIIHSGLESLRERLDVRSGVLEEESKVILKDFFSKVRNGKSKNPH